MQITEKRLREAEQKLRLVRIYSRQIEKESLEYKGAIHGLINALEVEIPNACASLDRMVDSLEKYAALAPPEIQAGGGRLEAEGTTLQPTTYGLTPPAEDDKAGNPTEAGEASESGRQTE